MSKILEYISSRLEQKELRHEIHQFESGAVMIDIWKDGSFYVVEIDGKRIGLSLVTADTGFNTMPDKTYDSLEKFRVDFEKIF
jgi:hypothetical protein